MQKNITKKRITIFALVVFVLIPKWAYAQESPTYDDPYYKQKGTDQIIAERSISTFQKVQESVDPFTGNLNILNTDALLPGNGGLDLRIQRSYNSRIWGRKDITAPGLVAINERSIVGLGWSFHFGRVLNPAGTGSNDRFNPNNPVLELPDGSSHPFYKDKNDTSRLISREFWLYKQSGSNTFTVTLTDGTVYTFSGTNSYITADGVLVYQVASIATTNGNTMTFTYNSTDRRQITSLTDSVGRSVTFSYTTLSAPNCVGPDQPNPKVLSTINLNGKTYTYLHQVTNCEVFLTEVKPPVGPSWKYTYNTANPGQFELKTVTYPNGSVFTYVYSDISFDTGLIIIPFTVVKTRSLSSTRGVPATSWTYTYSATSATNQVTTITQSGCKTERYTYSSFGAISSNSGAVNVLWKIGMLLKKEILSGSTVKQTETYTWSASPTISNDQITNGNWNGLGGSIWDNGIFVPLLSSKVVSRDGQTYTSSYSNYDDYGNPRTISESGDDNRTTTLTYYYNTTDNIVKDHPYSESVTVGSTFNTYYDYDSNGNLTSLNRYGVLTTFGYTNGNVTSSKNARNYTTTFQYDHGTVSYINNPLYHISRSINWEGTIQSETNGRNYTTQFTYDSLNRITQINPPLETTTTITYDNSGATYWKVTKGSTNTQFNMDGLGRVSDTSGSESIKTDTNYNACGQTSYQSYPYTTLNRGDSFFYDMLDRVTKVTHPDSKTQTFTFSNSNIAVINERGITVTYDYTAFGNPDEKRLTSVADAVGTTAYDYNTVGSVTDITQPGSVSRSFTYDSHNFLASESHPETGSISYGRDAIGNMTSKNDGKGTASYTYDALDRLTDINYPAGTDDVSLDYDNADNRTSLSSSAANYSYSYDAENRLTQENYTISGNNYTTSFGYDTRGNLTSLTYPTGRSISYGYDTANRVTSLTGYVSSVTYHPSGGMATISYANGKSTTIGYNNRYQVGSISTPAVINYTYSYDGVGNVTGIVDGLNGSRTRSMGYDNVDRLTSASGIWGSMAFTYSAAGNRLTKTYNMSATTYNYINNRLTSATGGEPDSFSYDANGNMTSIRGFTLIYDAANRMTAVSGTDTFTYDGDGKRIKKVTAVTGDTVIYHYDPTGNILAETDTNGSPQNEYLYINGQHVVKINSSPAPGPPSNLAATVVSGSQVNLTWTASPGGGVDHYEVWKSSNNSIYSLIASPATTSFSDTTVTGGTTYLYKVRAVDGAGSASNYSNADYVTTILFTDNPLVAGSTVIKAQHIVELRQAVNAVRASAGLGAATWTDSTLAGALVKAIHIQELRTNLSQALINLGFPAPSYTDPTLTTGVTSVMMVHIDELRNEVK